MDGDVRMEIRDGVAELVLDRPAKHNAVTPAMARRLLDRYEELWQGRIDRMTELVTDRKEKDR